MQSPSTSRDGFEQSPCPKCGSLGSATVFSGKDHLHGIPGEYFVSECLCCGLWFQNPRPTPDRLASLYPPDYGPHAKAASPMESRGNDTPMAQFPKHYLAAMKGLAVRAMPHYRRGDYLYRHLGYTHLPRQEHSVLDWRSWPMFDSMKHRQYAIDLVPRYVAEGKLLEIGCANGQRLLALRNLGWQHLYGVELVPAAAAQAIERGFLVESGAVEAVLPLYPNDFFDVVVASMVLEHLRNPFQVVNQIASKIRPGGQFLFSTISRDSLDARIYGAYWSGFDFPRHMVHFRKKEILNMLRDHFERIECHHQAAPIDFARPATWRGKPSDRAILTIARSALGNRLCGVMAQCGLTCRVSFCCSRKISG